MRPSACGLLVPPRPALSVRLFWPPPRFCISLVTNEIEHLSVCLLATGMSSLGKCLFRSLAYLLFILFTIKLCEILYILDTSPLSDI